MWCDEYLAEITNSELLPEIKLWLYVLAEAIREAAAGRYDECYWLLEDERMYVGSYNWVCEVLDINPTRLRRLLERRWGFIKTDRSAMMAVILGE